MKNFVRCLAAVAVVIFSPLAAFADVYLITDLKVDVTDESSAQARSKAFAQAKVEGAHRLINRLTSYKDRTEAGLVINYDIANRLASAVDVQDEKQSGTRYLARLSVKFDPNAVSAFLNVFDVPYVDSQAARALILPNAGAGVVADEWVAVWSGQASEHTLAPWVGGVREYPSMSTWSSVAQDVHRNNASRAVIALASASGGAYYVRMKEVRAGEEEPRNIGSAGPFNSLEEAREGIVSYLENDWKARTIVRADDQTSVSAIARFGSRAGWVEIEKSLKSSRLAKDYQLQALSSEGADVRFVFVGRPDQLATELRASGVVFSAAEEGWLLESALGR